MAPVSVGLYNPAFEHDACGVAMVADMHGRRSRDIVDKAITALVNLEHRGAQGAEPHTGDGAGILLQVPDEFVRAVVEFELPEAGSYATGIAFLPQSSKDAAAACEAVEKIAEAEGLEVLGWRDVPTDDSSLGALARDAMPTFRQVFIAGASGWTWSVAHMWCASAPSTNWARKARARTAPVAKPCTSQVFPVRPSSTREC
jgi:glutamate synthase (NADPH/NADH) large chain